MQDGDPSNVIKVPEGQSNDGVVVRRAQRSPLPPCMQRFARGVPACQGQPPQLAPVCAAVFSINAGTPEPNAVCRLQAAPGCSSPSRNPSPSPGFDYELYNRNDIERILGDKAWCISFKDSACRCFGYMVSKKKYIYTIDDDCFVCVPAWTNSPLQEQQATVLQPRSRCRGAAKPARLPHQQCPLAVARPPVPPAHPPRLLPSRPCSAKNPTGEDINALEQHIKNLLSPSTPDFFNTLYDPYRPGACAAAAAAAGQDT